MTLRTHLLNLTTYSQSRNQIRRGETQIQDGGEEIEMGDLGEEERNDEEGDEKGEDQMIEINIEGGGEGEGEGDSMDLTQVKYNLRSRP